MRVQTSPVPGQPDISPVIGAGKLVAFSTSKQNTDGPAWHEGATRQAFCGSVDGRLGVCYRAVWPELPGRVRAVTTLCVRWDQCHRQAGDVQRQRVWKKACTS